MRISRPAAVAGTFYPGSALGLAETVASLLAQVDAAEADEATADDASLLSPKALIVPHAGYVYSGPVAATAYARLAAARGAIRRVVLLGPSHYVGFCGLALPAATAFATPLGEIRLAPSSWQELAGLPQVRTSDEAHAAEHSLEVQLPFLQTVLGDFELVPLAVGDAGEDEVAEVLDRLWGGAETLIAVSSDLSHYHRYDSARLLDRETAAQIAARAPLADYTQACGAVPINGLLACARQRRMAVDLLDLRNSGDTAGDRSRVVGYGSFAFHEERMHD